ADEQRGLSPTFDFLNTGRRLLQPPGDAGGFPRVQDVQQVMANASALFPGGLGGADVHAAIERHGVHADDLGVESGSQLQGQAALARAGRAGQNQNVVEHVGAHAGDYSASRAACQDQPGANPCPPSPSASASLSPSGSSSISSSARPTPSPSPRR